MQKVSITIAVSDNFIGMAKYPSFYERILWLQVIFLFACVDINSFTNVIVDNKYKITQE